MDYSVHTGQRADLIATLRQFEADRRERHEHERADDAARAATELESGQPSTYFERVCYAVGDHDRYAVRRATRATLTQELTDAITGWEHHGKPHIAEQARQALATLAKGARDARVGHIRYEATD